ncbi:MAG: glycosyltransferase [Cellulomonadaceae bacterium]|jgi:glycosyltransferase involved in cell wall biosynthesis|nr:glycosyltransferase [Cellulomonadaceae bacterium]
MDGVVRIVYRNPALLGAIRKSGLDQVGQRIRLTGTETRPPRLWMAPNAKWGRLLARLDTLEPILLAESERQGLPVTASDNNKSPRQLEAEARIHRIIGNVELANAQDKLWLLATTIAARYPAPETFQKLNRAARFGSNDELGKLLLALLDSPDTAGRLDLEMQVITDPIVEADSTGKLAVHTGIHRVAREVVNRWITDHNVTVAMWDKFRPALLTPTTAETDRIVSGNIPKSAIARLSEKLDKKPKLLVPWHTIVVLLDAPKATAGLALSALAQYSGSDLTAIGYDLIPIVSAELRPGPDTGAALAQLVPLKRAKKIAAISHSAAREFQGFSSMLAAQGLPGPDVVAVPLPNDVGPTKAVANTSKNVENGRPIVLLTGSREPHKNHRTLLHAAESLWDEGLEFEVRLAGGSGWRDDALDTIERLHAAGNSISDLGRVTEEALAAELVAADVVAFASLHEGFGLPVAEALTAGTPVLTTDYGSQAEIAADGGVLVVDPRDDEAIISALRRLITEPALRAELRAQALARVGARQVRGPRRGKTPARRARRLRFAWPRMFCTYPRKQAPLSPIAP